MVIKVFKGELGTPPVIQVNGEEASLDTPIKEGDHISYVRGTDGTDAHIFIKDLIPLTEGRAWVNGEEVSLVPTLTVNGEKWDIDREIPDRAQIKALQANQLNNVLLQAGVPAQMLEETIYHYRLNGEDKICRWLPIEVTVNGRPAQLQDLIDWGDRVGYQLKSAEPRIRDIPGSQELLKLMVTVNGQPVELNSRQVRLLTNGRQVDLDDLLTDGLELQLDRSHNQAIFSDIFRVIEVKPNATGRLLMYVDGESAGFTTPISDGSKIELSWES